MRRWCSCASRSPAIPLSAQAQADLDPRVERLVAAVSQDQLVVILRRLESFGTRNTMSSTESTTRGIGAARQWILDELKGFSPRLQVSFDTYRIAKQGRITGDVEARNVMAVLPGRSGRRIYISGHYDTVAVAGGQTGRNSGSTQPITFADPDSTAPGVNDDGSGVALTMELARVFSTSGIEFDATLVFMCHVAEEQGLMGAKLHAQKAAKERVVIDAVLNNDIVGNDRGGSGTIDGASIRVYRKVRKIQRRESWRDTSSAGRRDTCRRIASGCFLDRTGSRGAAITPRTTRPVLPPSDSGSRGRISLVSTLPTIRSRACRRLISRKTPVSTPPRLRRSRWRHRRQSSSTTKDSQRSIVRRPVRCAPAVEGLSRRVGLSHLLARGVGPGLAARDARGERHGRDTAEHAD